MHWNIIIYMIECVVEIVTGNAIVLKAEYDISPNSGVIYEDYLLFEQATGFVLFEFTLIFFCYEDTFIIVYQIESFIG